MRANECCPPPSLCSVDINDFVEFVSDGAVSPVKAGRSGETATGAAPVAVPAPAPSTPSRAPAPAESSATPAEKARFAVFRAGWEARHGAAAAKELRLDAARQGESPGPTWTAHSPKPFKVVHLKDEPPCPHTV